jgi:hypothetical protein
MELMAAFARVLAVKHQVMIGQEVGDVHGGKGKRESLSFKASAAFPIACKLLILRERICIQICRKIVCLRIFRQSDLGHQFPNPAFLSVASAANQGGETVSTSRRRGFDSGGQAENGCQILNSPRRCH